MADDSPPQDNGDPPSSPVSPTSTGFNTDQLPLNSSQNYSDYDDDEASVDPPIIGDALEDNVNDDEEEEQGEDLFNDDFMESVSIYPFFLLKKKPLFYYELMNESWMIYCLMT